MASLKEIRATQLDNKVVVKTIKFFLYLTRQLAHAACGLELRTG